MSEPKKERNRPRIPAKRPLDRHYLNRVGRSTLVKERYSLIVSEVDIQTDVHAINDGLAERSGMLFTIDGRTYGQEPSGRLYLDGSQLDDGGRRRSVQSMEAQNEELKMVLYWTDLFLSTDVPDALIRTAMASAFDLPIEAVGISMEATDEGMQLWRRPETKILIQRMREEQPGGFPVGLTVSLKADTVREPVKNLSALARHLEAAIITDVETPEYTDTQWRLVAPDGWSGVVTVDFDAFNRDAFVLTPEARALLDAHTPRSSVRHAS